MYEALKEKNNGGFVPQDLKERLYVSPDSVVPLCVGHHQLYDAHRLDLLAEAKYLTLEEQANAVMAVGIYAAYKRLTGRRPE